MMDDGPPGLAIDAARRIVIDHVENRCGQCKERRCWLLESALKTVLFDESGVRSDIIGAATHAAKRIADVHRSGDDGLCSPCLLPIAECEPFEIASSWLQVIGEPVQPAEPRTAVDVLTPALDNARRTVRNHQGGYGCPQCTPEGCPAEDAAVPVVFDAVVASWPEGPKTLAEVERIADEIRGDD